jgi:hypothetical protein
MADTSEIHRALIFGMITMSAVDRQMSNAELQTIGSVVRQFPVFADYDEENLIQDAEDCSKILVQDDGFDQMLELIATTVPERLYETAYALAVEVAAADLRVKAEEIRFLELLSFRLNIEKLTTAAIERSARARYQKI